MRKIQKPNFTEWVEHDEDKDIKIEVKPVSIHIFNKVSGLTDLSVQDMFNIFNYAVVDWKGYLNTSGKPLEVNEENKALVFDLEFEKIVPKVVNEAFELRQKGVISEKEVKN